MKRLVGDELKEEMSKLDDVEYFYNKYQRLHTGPDFPDEHIAALINPIEMIEVNEETYKLFKVTNHLPYHFRRGGTFTYSPHEKTYWICPR